MHSPRRCISRSPSPDGAAGRDSPAVMSQAARKHTASSKARDFFIAIFLLSDDLRRFSDPSHWLIVFGFPSGRCRLFRFPRHTAEAFLVSESLRGAARHGAPASAVSAVPPRAPAGSLVRSTQQLGRATPKGWWRTLVWKLPSQSTTQTLLLKAGVRSQYQQV